MLGSQVVMRVALLVTFIYTPRHNAMTHGPGPCRIDATLVPCIRQFYPITVWSSDPVRIRSTIGKPYGEYSPGLRINSRQECQGLCIQQIALPTASTD
jgi:hypothetical protein